MSISETEIKIKKFHFDLSPADYIFCIENVDFLVR